MKSVLISIKPKWCELIASGKKTVEVRKTRPKIETPFKCYIYCTKEKYKGKYLHTSNKPNRLLFWKNPNDTDINVMPDDYTYRAYTCKGKVIGEFVCDAIYDCRDVNMDDTCITVAEWLKYTKGHKGKVYGWHISNIVIYDKPKDLDDFMAFGKTHCDQKNCKKCLYMGIDGICDVKDIGQPMSRPPQSWRYCEGLENEPTLQ